MGSSVFWIDPNRFDCCQHRIVSVSMMERLRATGLPISYVTSYLREAAPYPAFHYLDTRTRARGLYRVAFLVACLRFLCPHLRRDRSVVLIVFPQALYAAILAKCLGWARGCRVDIHVDFRTVPVFTRAGALRARIQYALEYLFFWRLPIVLSRAFATTYSFITERMRERVGDAGKPWCIWTSGVRDELIAGGIPQAAPSPPAPFELLYLGSMSPHRGVEELVRAVAGAKDDLGDLVLRIVGGGASEPAIRKRVREMGAEGRIVLEGTVAPERVPAFLERAHAFVSPLPDHPWWRVSSPIKLFEYLATGKPVILTETAPHRDAVPLDTPGVVWLRDLSPASVVGAIKDVRDNYEERLRGHEKRLAIANAHSWSEQANQLGEFLRRAYSLTGST